MCGRNSLFIDQADLEARFDAEVVTDGGYTPRYNIAPGDDLHIVTATISTSSTTRRGSRAARSTPTTGG